MIVFTAKGVAATELPDLNSKVVVLAEDADGDGLRLEIQRAITDTKQDRELGQDTYALCTHTGATTYGGVRWYVLDGSVLTMRLDEQAQDALGVPLEFSILLDADAMTIEKVRAALVSILGMESGRS